MEKGKSTTQLLGYTLTWENDDQTVEEFLSKRMKPRDSSTCSPCIVRVVESLYGFDHHYDLPLGKIFYVSGFSKQKRVLCCHNESQTCFFLPTEYFPITCFVIDPRTSNSRKYSSLNGAIRSEEFPIQLVFDKPLNLNVEGIEPFKEVRFTQEFEEAYLIGNLFDADGYHLKRSMIPLSSSLPLTVLPCKEAHHSGGKNLEDLIDLVSRATANFPFSPCPPPCHATILRTPELAVTRWAIGTPDVKHHCPLGRNDAEYIDFSDADLQGDTISASQKLRKGNGVHQFERIRTIPLLPSTPQRSRKRSKGLFTSFRNLTAKTKPPIDSTKRSETPPQDQINDGRSADDKLQAIVKGTDVTKRPKAHLDRTMSLPRLSVAETVSFAQEPVSAQVPSSTELPPCGAPKLPPRKPKVGRDKAEDFGDSSQSVPVTNVERQRGDNEDEDMTTKITPATLKGAAPVKTAPSGLTKASAQETLKPTPSQIGIDGPKQGAAEKSDSWEYCESQPLSSTYLSMSPRVKTSEKKPLRDFTVLSAKTSPDLTHTENQEGDDCVYEKIWQHESAPSPRSIDNWSTVPQDLDDLSVKDVSQCLKLLEMNQYVERVALDRVDGGMLQTLDLDMLTNHFKFNENDARKFQQFLEGWRPRWSTETDSSESTYDVCRVSDLSYVSA